MKKSTLVAISKILNGETIDNFEEIKQEVMDEVAKGEAKAKANHELYDSVKAVIMKHLDDTPKTIAQLYEECEDELPENFYSRSKIQYGCLNYWQDEIERHENGRNAYTYTKRVKGE